MINPTIDEVSNDDCRLCNNSLIVFDPQTPSLAKPVEPCLLWEATFPRGFIIRAQNRGTCKIYVYATTFDTRSEWDQSGQRIALLNNDGTQKITDQGVPITGIPFQQIGILDENNFEINKLDCFRFIRIGVLCVQINNTENICPICDAKVSITLSTLDGIAPIGEEMIYNVGNQNNVTTTSSSSGVTIRGQVDCNMMNDDTVMNITNLRARLIHCPECFDDVSRVIATVPLIAIPNDLNSATYIFRNVQMISCFKVEIICVAPTPNMNPVVINNNNNNILTRTGGRTTRGRTTNNNINLNTNRNTNRLIVNTQTSSLVSQNILTSNNVLASTNCRLVNGQRFIEIVPLTINCNACQDSLITIRGTVICSTALLTGNDFTNITVLLIPCVQKIASSEVKCASGNSLISTPCGSRLDEVTFTSPLTTSGTFSASVPIGCYFIRFVCTSNPTNFLVITGPNDLTSTTECNYYCADTTFTSITLADCSICPVEEIKISGSVVCSASGSITGLQDNMIAQLIKCNSACTSPTTTIVDTFSIDPTIGSYTFANIDPGCYQIRIICDSCSGVNSTTMTNIVGIIACATYTETVTTLPPLSINCVTCSTVQLSGTVGCESGSISNVILQLTQFPNGCNVIGGSTTTSIVVANSNGAYKTCIPIDMPYKLQAVCRLTNTPLTALPTTCTQISENTIFNINITDCTCPTTAATTSNQMLLTALSFTKRKNQNQDQNRDQDHDGNKSENKQDRDSQENDTFDEKDEIKKEKITIGGIDDNHLVNSTIRVFGIIENMLSCTTSQEYIIVFKSNDRDRKYTKTIQTIKFDPHDDNNNNFKWKWFGEIKQDKKNETFNIQCIDIQPESENYLKSVYSIKDFQTSLFIGVGIDKEIEFSIKIN